MKAYGRNFGRYNGRNISALFCSNGESAETVFSAETAIFGQSKPVLAKNTNFWPHLSNQHVIKVQQTTMKPIFWPKMLPKIVQFWLNQVYFGWKWLWRPKIALSAVTAVITVTAVMTAFFTRCFGVSAKILFWSHTNLYVFKGSIMKRQQWGSEWRIVIALQSVLCNIEEQYFCLSRRESRVSIIQNKKW